MPLIFNKDQSGIALLLVIGSIVLLTMLSVEFAYNAQIEYHLATRQKQRLQAYYLAQSAYNLTLLELRMGNTVQSQVGQAVQQANLQLPVDLSAPLCQQFPINTGLFRMLIGGGEGDQGPTAEEEPAELTGMAGLSLSGLEEFLQFQGDFEAECFDDSSRINLNYFYAQDPETKAPEGQENFYDAYKKFIVQFLSQPQFEELFKDQETTVPEIVRNIADWVDPNEVVNEPGGGQGGAEESVYRDAAFGNWTVKNGKFSTPGEIFRVAGVRDEWWIPLSEYFTIYGTTDPRGNPQINVCRAPEALVQALILRYLETRKDLPPLPVDPEAMGMLVAAVQGGCTGTKPDKNKIAGDLDRALLEVLKVGVALETTPGGEGGYARPANAFADWIASESRFYRLVMRGRVQDTVVEIQAVMDLGQGGGVDPRNWKLVYWKVN